MVLYKSFTYLLGHPDRFLARSAQQPELDSEAQIFCQVNNARLRGFPAGQISRNLTKFAHNTSIGVAMNSFGTEF